MAHPAAYRARKASTVIARQLPVTAMIVRSGRIPRPRVMKSSIVPATEVTVVKMEQLAQHAPRARSSRSQDHLIVQYAGEGGSAL